MTSLNLKHLLESGSHFGHETKRWNSKMKPYIFTSRNGIHIIDLEETVKLSESAYEFVKKLGREGKTLIFVGTKRQAKEIVKAEAKKCGAMYIIERWVGGLLTNHISIQKTIRHYNDMLETSKSESFAKMSKKDQALFQKDFARLDKLVGGIHGLDKIADALFILDIKRELIAVTEAKRMGVPVVAVCDTNSDPELVEYPIPGNDDALKSIAVFVQFIASAYEEGRQEAAKSVKKETEKSQTE